MHHCTVCGAPYETDDSVQLVCPECLKETKLCECGCGQAIQKWKLYRSAEERRFVHGHNGPWKGKKRSEEMKTKVSHTKDTWTDREKAILRKHYPNSTTDELRKLFPTRDPQAVRTKANRMGVYKSKRYRDNRGQRTSERQRGPDNPSWKGGRWAYSGHHYGPGWKKQRQRAKRRDQYTCQKCGKRLHRKSPKLHVHHIIPFNEFDYRPKENNNYIEANRLDNLICLCEKCHLGLHNGSVE